MNALVNGSGCKLGKQNGRSRLFKLIQRLFLLWITIVGLTGCLWLIPQPAQAVTDPLLLTPPLLTIETLQSRLRLDAGTGNAAPAIDLRRFTIDLRPENSSFREQFYRALQDRLSRPGSVPVGLDLSNSVIEGEFDLNQLGLRVPLYGEALSPIFSTAEQEQLRRDRRRLSQLQQLSQTLLLGASSTGALQITVLRGNLTLTQTRFNGVVNCANTFFLGAVDATAATFSQEADWSEGRFSQTVSFTNASFNREARFRNSIFFAKARFNRVQWRGNITFQGSEFRDFATFNQASFQQVANLMRVQWQANADFGQSRWQNQAVFNRDRFDQSLFLTQATFEQSVSFREAQFNRPVNLRGASILDQANFSDAAFACRDAIHPCDAYLNVAELNFDSEKAKIIGNPGQIGRVLSVPTLQGNETLLRNLVRNFRKQEQITDANQVEYTVQQLRLQQLRRELLGTNLNTARPEQLLRLGLTGEQVATILRRRLGEAGSNGQPASNGQRFRSPTELLSLAGFDLASYVKVRDRVVAGEALSPGSWLVKAFQVLQLSLLLWLSRYGTSFWLVFGVGLVAIAAFGLMFWLLDRLRRLRPRPIVPDSLEVVWMLGGFGGLTVWGITAIIRAADYPWLTLACLATFLIPLPALLLGIIYYRGRYHDLMDQSYFVEDGSMRQLRLLIGRLPVIPKFPLFRDRYTPIPCDRHWNWLNYYDFSLNNLLKFGFNDVRLRDQHLPGLITTLAWYQWTLGLFYFALLLWTLSRTIPGLNLLIYFK